MDFSIITPSFRNSQWLKLCIQSVADQKGVALEHIVQDAGSDDGTLDWLPWDARVRVFVEQDRGMYDAINRGFRRAQGDLLAYLNCDEQYLPGVLRCVRDFFRQDPGVDVVFGDCIVIDSSGNYLCERRALIPQLWHTRLADSLSFLTAGAFLRRSAVERLDLFFDPSFKVVGDAVWALRLIESRARMAVLGDFTSIFTETGNNLGHHTPIAVAERNDRRAATPGWMHLLKPAVLAGFRLRRWWAGHYSCRPYEYLIYTRDSPLERKHFAVMNPTFRWKIREVKAREP
jgi:glycosyltransferase involved in cell wall biosynthesis